MEERKDERQKGVCDGWREETGPQAFRLDWAGLACAGWGCVALRCAGGASEEHHHRHGTGRGSSSTAFLVGALALSGTRTELGEERGGLGPDQLAGGCRYSYCTLPMVGAGWLGVERGTWPSADLPAVPVWLQVP